MSNINIAGTTPVDDPEYRYKMPRLQAKIEGRGNGIKTVVVNAVEIASALHRTPGEVTKFFGTELGAQSKYDDATERAVVNGAFDAATMQSHLSKFIEIFVLCPNCRLPETKYKFKGKDSIFHKCMACGSVEPVDMNHRLTTYLLKEHSAAKRAKKAEGGKDKDKEKKKKKKDKGDDDDEPKEKKEKKDKKEKKEKKPKNLDSEEDDAEEEGEEIEWHTDLSAEAVAARAREAEALEAAAHAAMSSSAPEEVAATLDNLEIDDEAAIEAATEAITKFLSVNHSSAEIVEEVIRQQTCVALPVNDRLPIFFNAAFTNHILASNQIAKYQPVLDKLVDNERSQFQVIALVEHFCAIKYPVLLTSFPVILKLLYDEEILSEDIILAWNNDETRKLHAHHEVTATQAAALKKSLAPFIVWLENAEEGSDEEDEE